MPSGMIVPGKWEINYRYAAGPYATRFFEGLKERRIYGVRCPVCKRVLMPPRAFCEKCFVEVREWVEVGTTGVIENFQITYHKFHGLPDPPYALAVIKLSGADEGIIHFVCGADLSTPEKALEKLRIGAKVETVWAEERSGSILDIKCFKIID